jgi:hypothetical protein
VKMQSSNITILVKAMVGKSNASYFYLLEELLSFTNFTTNIKIIVKIIFHVEGNKIIGKKIFVFIR